MHCIFIRTYLIEKNGNIYRYRKNFYRLNCRGSHGKLDV